MVDFLIKDRTKSLNNLNLTANTKDANSTPVARDVFEHSKSYCWLHELPTKAKILLKRKTMPAKRCPWNGRYSLRPSPW